MLTVKVTKFTPFTLELPTATAFTGKVKVVLPSLHVKVLDLSMGNILPGAHLGVDGNVLSLDFDLGDAELSVGQMVELLTELAALLQQTHQLAQAELDKRPLLGAI